MLMQTNHVTLCLMQPDGGFNIKRTKSGLGLITTKPILKGKRIIEYVGPLVLSDVVDKSNKKYFFEVNTKWAIDGSGRKNLARYINHSCRPNAEAFVSGHRVWIWARKNIKAGEEISYDYGKEYFEWFIEPVGCRCDKCASKTKRAKTRKRRKH